MHLNQFVLPLILVAIAGCSSTQLAEPSAQAPVSTLTATDVQSGKPVSATQPGQAPASGQPAQGTVKTVTLHPLDDSRSALAKRSVYFDFDSSLIHDVDRPLIEAHARYLAANRSAMVRIEGNTDERGGREYNLALGQKRAEAVLRSMRLLGVPAGEMEAISFGGEKAVDRGHEEAAWAKNRRADLNYIKR